MNRGIRQTLLNRLFSWSSYNSYWISLALSISKSFFLLLLSIQLTKWNWARQNKSKAFYHTSSWKQLQQVPHSPISVCAEMDEKKRKKEIGHITSQRKLGLVLTSKDQKVKRSWLYFLSLCKLNCSANVDTFLLLVNPCMKDTMVFGMTEWPLLYLSLLYSLIYHAKLIQLKR